MFCTNCGGTIKYLEEANGGINQKGRYYGYCENCKIKVEIPESEIHAENANDNFQKMEEMLLKGAGRLDSLMEKAKDAGVSWWKNMRENAEIEAAHRRENAEIEAAYRREYAEIVAACQQDLTVPLSIEFGHEQLGIEKTAEMRQTLDGSVYFGYERGIRYKLVSYEWEGSEFQTVSDTVQKGRTKYRERSRMRGRGLATGAGALIGTAIMPGVGTVVGAAVGAAGPRKRKTRGRSVEKVSESQVMEQVEKDTLAHLAIQNIETGAIYKIMFLCNRRVDGMINCLNWDIEQEGQDIKSESTMQE